MNADEFLMGYFRIEVDSMETAVRRAKDWLPLDTEGRMPWPRQCCGMTPERLGVTSLEGRRGAVADVANISVQRLDVVAVWVE